MHVTHTLKKTYDFLEFPLAPESVVISYDMLSPKSKELLGYKKSYKSVKLTSTFQTRKRYVLHYMVGDLGNLNLNIFFKSKFRFLPTESTTILIPQNVIKKSV